MALNQISEKPSAGFEVSPLEGVAPLEVTFTDTSTGPITHWRMSFGDGQVQSMRSPQFTHVYRIPGSYSPGLQVDNGTYASRTRVEWIVATAPPLAGGFAMDPQTGVAPLTVTFRDASTPTAIAWAWDFGDGAASNEQHPVHTYTQPGVYYPTLTVADQSGSDTVRSETPVIVRGVATPTATPWYKSPVTLIAAGTAGYVVYRVIRSRA